MSWRRVAEDHLGFSRKERTGIISLLLITFIIYLIPTVYSWLRPPYPVVTAEVLAFIDSAQLPEEPAYQEQEYQRSADAELFAFDPNTLDKAGWVRLGLSRKTAGTIEKYRQKGGRFYRPEDLQKIWGLPPGFYERVKGHISIPPKEPQPIRQFDRTIAAPRQKPASPLVDINDADTAAFVSLPWIGEKLAVRILAFREKLGGFYSIEQIAETYGLPDSNFQKIRGKITVDPNAVRKINLNTATKEELKTHPYIRWNLANAIVNYREQHGGFVSVEDLKKIALIDEALYLKISPYFKLQ